MNEINLTSFTNILSLCKTLHWATGSSHYHSVLDTAFEDLTSLCDEFVEVALGIFGRKSATASAAEIKIVPDGELVKYVTSEFLSFNQYLLDISNGHPQLMAIVDRIKAKENQLIYLLSMD